MNADEVRRSLTGRWPDSEYLHVYEAPLDASRQGTKIDVLVLALWHSRHHAREAVEVKVSYSDWKKEIERVEWTVTQFNGSTATYDRKPGPSQLSWARGVWRTMRDPEVPDDFEPEVSRIAHVDTSKSEPWRRKANRFWIAAPAKLAPKIRDDIDRLALGWGVLACDGTSSRMVHKPKDMTPEPFTDRQWIGIVRAAADSGVQAIWRAEARGREQGHKEGEAAMLRKLEREGRLLPDAPTQGSLL